MRDCPDSELMNTYINGDKKEGNSAIITLIFGCHYKLFLSIAIKYMPKGKGAEAQDVIQEMGLRFLCKKTSSRRDLGKSDKNREGIENVKSYVRICIINQCKKQIKRYRNESDLPFEEWEEEVLDYSLLKRRGELSIEEFKELLEKIADIAGLGEKQKKVFKLYCYNFEIKEIAEKINESPKNVSSNLHLAKTNIRKRWEQIEKIIGEDYDIKRDNYGIKE